MFNKIKNIITQKNIKIKTIISIVIIIISLIFLIFNYSNKSNITDLEKEFKYNKNKSFSKKQNVSGLVFKNIKCTFDGKNSLISYTIVNETDDVIYLDNYDIIVKDKDKVKLTKIATHMTETLNPKKSVDMSNQIVGVDLTKAYYMELVINKDKNKNNS